MNSPTCTSKLPTLLMHSARVFSWGHVLTCEGRQLGHDDDATCILQAAVSNNLSVLKTTSIVQNNSCFTTLFALHLLHGEQESYNCQGFRASPCLLHNGGGSFRKLVLPDHHVDFTRASSRSARLYWSKLFQEISFSYTLVRILDEIV